MAKNPSSFKKPSAFHILLRKNGFKATSPRLAILEIFNAAKHPLAAQEIIDKLPRINHVTIYRTITSLKTNGIIRQIDLRHNHAHYELAGTKEHHHLVCLRCGRIEDVHRCGIEDMQGAVLRASKQFAEIREHALEFYGVCKVCAKKIDAGGSNEDIVRPSGAPL